MLVVEERADDEERGAGRFHDLSRREGSKINASITVVSPEGYGKLDGGRSGCSCCSSGRRWGDDGCRRGCSRKGSRGVLNHRCSRWHVLTMREKLIARTRECSGRGIVYTTYL